MIKYFCDLCNQETLPSEQHKPSFYNCAANIPIENGMTHIMCICTTCMNKIFTNKDYIIKLPEIIHPEK